MAPQVGLEPTTDRLTADSSTTELLWNNMCLSSSTNIIISITHKFSSVNVKKICGIFTLIQYFIPHISFLQVFLYLCSNNEYLANAS